MTFIKDHKSLFHTERQSAASGAILEPTPSHEVNTASEPAAGSPRIAALSVLRSGPPAVPVTKLDQMLSIAFQTCFHNSLRLVLGEC